MTGKRFLVFGTVQGVGFRWSACRAARGLQLTGWCRNLRDGSVEVCAYGDEARISQLNAWLSQGPPSARVERVEAYLLDDAAPRSFEIFR